MTAFVIKNGSGTYIRSLMFKETGIGRVCTGWAFTSKLKDAHHFETEEAAQLAVTGHAFCAIVHDSVVPEAPGRRLNDLKNSFGSMQVVQVAQRLEWQEVS